MHEEDDILPIGVGSLSDYTPHKLHLLLSLPIPIHIEASQEKSANNIDAPVQVQKRPGTKLKKASRKSEFIRYFAPINRLRSSSVPVEQEKFHQKPIPIKPRNPHDMRFLIMRHGERVDRYFGPNWYMLAFDQQNQYRPYHQNFPSQLPMRPNKYFWALDTPLTMAGLNAAKRLGKTFALKNYQPQYVYSSPAMRCVMTTIQILKGLGLENTISIRIEPGLLELGASRFGMNIFFQPNDWYKYGINVDLSYRPILTTIPAIEHENYYYLRSKHVVREIEKLHNDSQKELTNILLVGHATSPETLTWDLVGKKPNVNDLYRLSLNIAYLQTTVIERHYDNKSWSVKTMRLV